MSRSVKIDLGDGDALLSIEIKGCICGAEDLQMALVAFARQWKRERRPKPQATAAKPCGCGEPK